MTTEDEWMTPDHKQEYQVNGGSTGDLGNGLGNGGNESR